MFISLVILIAKYAILNFILRFIFLSYQLKMQNQGIAANKIYAITSIQIRVIVTMTKKYLIKITKATC